MMKPDVQVPDLTHVKTWIHHLLLWALAFLPIKWGFVEPALSTQVEPYENQIKWVHI